MIRSFADNETQRFYETGKSRRLPTELLKRAMMRLLQLHAATKLEDLRAPASNNLEALRGDRKGQWSVRINQQWRLCFVFKDGDALEVAVVDYH
jgi:toxin HigB-1